MLLPMLRNSLAIFAALLIMAAALLMLTNGHVEPRLPVWPIVMDRPLLSIPQKWELVNTGHIRLGGREYTAGELEGYIFQE